MPTKSISDGFKADIVNQIKAGAKVEALARQYNLGNSTIYKWLRQDIKTGCSCNLKTKIKRLEAEQEALLAIIGKYRAQEEALKKRLN